MGQLPPPVPQADWDRFDMEAAKLENARGQA